MESNGDFVGTCKAWTLRSSAASSPAYWTSPQTGHWMLMATRNPRIHQLKLVVYPCLSHILYGVLEKSQVVGLGISEPSRVVSTVQSTDLQLVAPSPCHCWDEWWIPTRDRCPQVSHPSNFEPPLFWVCVWSAAYETGCCLWGCMAAIPLGCHETISKQNGPLTSSRVPLAHDFPGRSAHEVWPCSGSWWFQPIWKVLVNEDCT